MLTYIIINAVVSLCVCYVFTLQLQPIVTQFCIYVVRCTKNTIGYLYVRKKNTDLSDEPKSRLCEASVYSCGNHKTSLQNKFLSLAARNGGGSPLMLNYPKYTYYVIPIYLLLKS